MCRQLNGGRVTLEFCSNDKIGDIKKNIERKNGIPAALQYLVWSGRVLDDSYSLFWYGIKNEATLHLSNKLRGGGPKVHWRNQQFSSKDSRCADLSFSGLH